ncbi:DUF2059 domain-containing protein [Halopseudomonas formosensis]|uniref:DUF2059 domain-containing protein n=1 Tax=Halopseudomonas formosensis TaxID=1002526 RepID=A0ABU5BVJ8_9GAMM|nr:DUF2059 domain-containing protein [Halopseudomonas formosensis]MDX9686802.1 DUF2059 domain-containing protein [Halopseudomonas formosensis]
MRPLCLLLLCCLSMSSVALASEAGHRAAAERFLKLARAQSMTAPLYVQTDQLLVARFAQLGGSMQHETLLREYRERARTLLDRQLAWEAIRDELIELYLPVFSEQEFEELARFYESEVGSKLLEHLPELTRGSMAIARERVEEVLAPQLEQLIEEMGRELELHQLGPTDG